MPEWAKVVFILGIELNHFGLEVVTTVGTTVFSDLVRRWASSGKGGPLLSPSLSLVVAAMEGCQGRRCPCWFGSQAVKLSCCTEIKLKGCKCSCNYEGTSKD